jgi:hypothetical protein
MLRMVFIAAHPAEAHLVRGLLESEGIDAVVRGEALFGIRGLTPVTADSLPSVWVHDADVDRAIELIAAPSIAASSAARLARAWRCATCNEFVGPEFASCWHCGAADPVVDFARRA